MNIQEEIIKIMDREAPHHSIRDENSKALPFGDVGLDSLDLMTIMMAIQEKIGVDIPDEDIPLLNTFLELVDYVKRKKH